MSLSMGDLSGGGLCLEGGGSLWGVGGKGSLPGGLYPGGLCLGGSLSGGTESQTPVKTLPCRGKKNPKIRSCLHNQSSLDLWLPLEVWNSQTTVTRALVFDIFRYLSRISNITLSILLVKGPSDWSTGSELLATSQLTIHPLPPKVGKFKWNYIFSGGKFPISTVFCNSLSVPNVSQTCKLVNNTLIGPEGPRN